MQCVVPYWIIKHKGIKVLCKCTSVSHIDENLISLDFDMEDADYKRLDSFRVPFFDNMKVKYRESDEGVLIHQVPNQDPKGIEEYVPSFGTNKETMKF